MGTPFSPLNDDDAGIQAASLEQYFDRVAYHAMEDLGDQSLLKVAQQADEDGLTDFSYTKAFRIGDNVAQRNVLDLSAAFNFLGTTMFLAQKLAEDTSLSEEERIIMLEDAADLSTDDTVKHALGAVAHDINMGHYPKPK